MDNYALDKITNETKIEKIAGLAESSSLSSSSINNNKMINKIEYYNYGVVFAENFLIILNKNTKTNLIEFFTLCPEVAIYGKHI